MNFDVWWFRLQRDDAAEFSFLPRVAPGKALGVIPREGYDQIAYLGPKGTDSQLRARGIEAFRRDVSALLSEATESVATLTSMDDIRHLDVRVDRLRRWHADGLMCIGDAAHAMSPLGGVGINLAIHRKNPVLRIKEGDTYVAVASNAGATSHPSWYRNLITHPQVLLQDGATVYQLRAREADGEDKAHWWDVAERFWPHFPEYRAKAGGRDIPVMLLEPTETPGAQKHLDQDGES